MPSRKANCSANEKLSRVPIKADERRFLAQSPASPLHMRMFLFLFLSPTVLASIQPPFPVTGFTAPIPGFPSNTFPLLHPVDDKAARVTFSNLRNLQQPQVVPSEYVSKEAESGIGGEETTEDVTIDEEWKTTTEGLTIDEEGDKTTWVKYKDSEYDTTDDTLAKTSRVLISRDEKVLAGRDEKSLIGSFPNIENHQASNHVEGAAHHQRGQEGHSGNHPRHHQGEVYKEHEATSNTINLLDAKKFELIHNFEQQGGVEEVKDGRRCINKVRVVLKS